MTRQGHFAQRRGRMSHSVIQRTEMLGASLNLGGQPLDLSEYSTTGLMALADGAGGLREGQMQASDG